MSRIEELRALLNDYDGNGMFVTPVENVSALLDCAEACATMIEWDAREQDHAVDFNARMELCQLAFDKARAALTKLEGRE